MKREATIGEVVDDIQPFFHAVSKAQREWVELMRSKEPGITRNEEMFIALVALVHSYGRLLEEAGVPVEALQQLERVGHIISQGIRMSVLPLKGMDA